MQIQKIQRLLAQLPEGFAVQRVGVFTDGDWFTWLTCPDGGTRLYNHRGHGWDMDTKRWLTDDEIVPYIVRWLSSEPEPIPF